jgi:hypothetical protein
MRHLLLLLVLFLASCDQRADQLLDKISGHETQTVVLAKIPTIIESAGLTLRSEVPLKIIGNSSHLCLVLKSGIPLAPQPVMEKLFREGMQGATVTATLQMKDGKKFSLAQPGQAWKKFGQVTSEEEISACFSCACGPRPAVGAEVSEITVKSSPTIKVLGIYWESTNAFDQNTKGN